MTFCKIVAFATLMGATVPIFAQQRVDERNLHERLIAVVPLVGAGTYTDPKRPLHAPAAATPGGIIAFNWQPSDDGRFAIVEFVARDRAAFAPILADPRVEKAFQKGVAQRQAIQSEIRRFKRDFDFEAFTRRSR